MSISPSTKGVTRRILDAATATTLLEPNSARKSATFYNDSTAILYLLLGKALYAEASSSITLDDSDTAAADGVAVYVVLDQEEQDFWYGHLEFVSPTGANASVTVKNGGASLTVYDSDDAATNGAALRVRPAEAGFEATFLRDNKPVLILLSNGKYLYVFNVNSATSDSPQVYCDEDGTNSYERLQAVVVDNGNETALAFIFDEIPTTSVFTVPVAPADFAVVDFEFKGKVTGIWSTDASGAVLVTELT
jgi:hypothetical protein